MMYFTVFHAALQWIKKLAARNIIKRLVLLALPILFFTAPRCLYSEEALLYKGKDFEVFYGPQLSGAARELIQIYPGIRQDLEGTFGWGLRLRPTIWLIKERHQFLRLAPNALSVAFAVPERHLIVIDQSRMKSHPFSLEITLKHELCHLLLHAYTHPHLLPRWLEEGICQWVNGGIADIIMDQRASILNRAAVSGSFIPLGALEKRFPTDREDHLLAYEESRGFVAFMVSKLGRQGILLLLEHLKKGCSTHTAFLQSFGRPLGTFEKEWHNSLKGSITWVAMLGYHLYEVLFALMALVTFFAFIRILLKKRTYKSADMEDDPPSLG